MTFWPGSLGPKGRALGMYRGGGWVGPVTIRTFFRAGKSLLLPGIDGWIVQLIAKSLYQPCLPRLLCVLIKYVQYDVFCKCGHDGTLGAGSSANMFDKTLEQKFHSSVTMAVKVIVSFIKFMGIFVLQQL